MSDIVERLRDPTPPHHGKCLAAAAEIERLRKRLELREPDWPEEADGIACRDDTIALLDDRVARQSDEITRLRAQCEVMAKAIEHEGYRSTRLKQALTAYRAAYPQEGREDE